MSITPLGGSGAAGWSSWDPGPLLPRAGGDRGGVTRPTAVPRAGSGTGRADVMGRISRAGGRSLAQTGGAMPAGLRRYPIFHEVLQGQRSLGRGEAGAPVQALQRLLTDLGYGAQADGAFGPRTGAAVLGFQRAHGLSQTGSVNRETLVSLGRAAASRSATASRAARVSSGRLPGNMGAVLRYRDEIAASASRHGVPASMVAAIIDAESNGDPNARSFDGGHGKGLMQIDDRHHAFARTGAVWDPQRNIDYGTRLLGDSLRALGGNTRATIASYNAGLGAVRRGLARGIDPARLTFDRGYVDKIEGLMVRYRPQLP